ADGAEVAPEAPSAKPRLVDHPRRNELARWLEDSLRDREIDVALLGGHKYMINSCLGIKASAGEFRLKLANPSVRFENTGIVLTLAIDHVAFSALKLRMRPNPNPLELCKFGKKFEVGGAMEDVRLTLRFDPLYDPERCRVGLWGDANPEVRIGNLNLKPLQNDLDKMAKNMVEDALTFALQVSVDGMYSALGDLLFSAVDQFLEADCPTKPGEAGRTTTRIGGVLGGAATSGGARSGGSGGATSGSTSGSAGATTNASPDVQALLARIATLETRIAELETGGPPPGDLEGLLGQAIERLGALDARAAGPELRDLLARFLGLALERSRLGDPRTLMDELTRMVVDPRPRTAEPVGAAASSANVPWYLVPNPELKGRMGRVVVRFPDAKLASGTYVELHRDGKEVTHAYGEPAWELLPGMYDVQVLGVRVAGCEVRSGHDTLVRTGMLTIELGAGTFFRLFQKGEKQELTHGYGSLTTGLLCHGSGEYEVEIQDQRAPVTVREGEIAKF
ncbi:MAG: hypothetical protein HOP15_07130, partial [Planctomycetes bacterium]|nr:hypothetical protein [Planctomycetota bacterium]